MLHVGLYVLLCCISMLIGPAWGGGLPQLEQDCSSGKGGARAARAVKESPPPNGPKLRFYANGKAKNLPTILFE